ncbi:MAG: hypothetical protein ABDH59_06830, partial [Fervidobacterium sp.]
MKILKILLMVFFILVMVSCTLLNLNNPPTKPMVVSPKDGETVYDISEVTLSWECNDADGDTLAYDVYFGTTQTPPLVKSGHTSKTYVVSGLENGKTYYWKIVAKDGKGGTAESNIWKFTSVILRKLK